MAPSEKSGCTLASEPSEPLLRAREALFISPPAEVACLAPAAASADQVIEATGPIHQLHVGDDLSCQVSYGDSSYEFYPPAVAPGDCGAFVAVDGTLYAPGFDGHGTTATAGLGSYEPFTQENQSPVSGSGTATSAYTVETLVRAGTSGITLRQRVSYVAGMPSSGSI